MFIYYIYIYKYIELYVYSFIHMLIHSLFFLFASLLQLHVYICYVNFQYKKQNETHIHKKEDSAQAASPSTFLDKVLFLSSDPRKRLETSWIFR